MSRVFEHQVRVPYADVDQMGFVYYANYLVYFEMARNALLREVGLCYKELEARGVMLPVMAAHCDYRQPAHYDDLLTIKTICSRLKGVRLVIEYEVWRDDQQLMTGYTHHVCMNRSGKPMRPDPELVALVAS